MTTTTYYNLNIAEGTDIVNPLTVDNPNYEKIDEAMHDNAVAGVTLATELTNSTIHALTRENSDCSVIRFIATSQWKAGDSVTVDGVPVLALLPSGETLPDGAYVINANVLCVLTGTNLTVYVGKKADKASEITYNDTTVAAELLRQDGEIVRQSGEIVRLDGEVENVNSELTLDYSSSSLDNGTDINTFLQKVLEKLFPKIRITIEIDAYGQPASYNGNITISNSETSVTESCYRKTVSVNLDGITVSMTMPSAATGGSVTITKSGTNSLSSIENGIGLTIPSMFTDSVTLSGWTSSGVAVIAIR